LNWQNEQHRFNSATLIGKPSNPVKSMNGLQEWSVQCPYCGEDNELLIDTSIEQQDYVEDCQVCCQPMLVHVTVNDSEVAAVEVARENG
jgi:hypothetical protein